MINSNLLETIGVARRFVILLTDAGFPVASIDANSRGFFNVHLISGSNSAIAVATAMPDNLEDVDTWGYAESVDHPAFTTTDTRFENHRVTVYD